MQSLRSRGSATFSSDGRSIVTADMKLWDVLSGVISLSIPHNRSQYDASKEIADIRRKMTYQLMGRSNAESSVHLSLEALRLIQFVSTHTFYEDDQAALQDRLELLQALKQEYRGAQALRCGRPHLD